jgi:hypothetical protein
MWHVSEVLRHAMHTPMPRGRYRPRIEQQATCDLDAVPLANNFFSFPRMKWSTDEPPGLRAAPALIPCFSTTFGHVIYQQ